MQPDQHPPTQPWLSPADIATRMGVTSRTARRLLAEGQLPFVQVTGTTRRVKPEDFEAFIKARYHSQQPTTKWTNVA